MIFNCVKNLNILLCVILLVFKASFGQECSSDGVNCISCTEYQNCNGTLPKGRVVSCKTGENCADDHLKQCQIKLNCYALNECTQAGIFPDVMVDSNYYVCLNDGSSGFLKYEFNCPEENFFDKTSLTCIPREVTLATTEVPSSSVSADPTASTGSTSSSTATDPISSTSSSTTVDPTSSTSASSTTDPTSSTTLSTTVDPTSSTSASSTTDPSSSTTSTTVDPTSSTTASSTTDPSSSTSSSTTVNPTSSTSTSSTSTPTTPSPTTMPFSCPASGIFPNPDNCKMYYRCSTSLKAFFYICPGNSYFNEIILKCSMTITPACQEQILKNSTSTIPPTTSTVTTTTTTPKLTTSTTTTTTKAPTTTTTPVTTTTTPVTTSTTPVTTTTTTATTTTTPSSTTPFSCPVSGIFANPSNCKIYYRCTLSGTIFQYICPGNTYFNEYTKRCSLVITPRCKNLIQG